MKHFRARPQKSGKTYYYFDAGGTPRKEIPLGSDYVLAVQKWAAMMNQAKPTNVADFEALAKEYETKVIPTKAKSTQATNKYDLVHLRAFFNSPKSAPLDQIKPHHIYLLLQKHKATPTTANRLKRLFSHMFNMARNWGYTEKENPVKGVEGFGLPKREVDVSDAVYRAVWMAGSEPLRDAMDLAYLTGQRPGDTVSMTDRNIVDGLLVFKQGKTGQKMRIRIEGELQALIERIKRRKDGYKIHCSSLVVNMRGMAMTQGVLATHFEKAREAAAQVANVEMAEEIRKMWFYDLRAKAADDTAEKTDEQIAANLLGHENVATTRAHYLRRGKLVKPTK